MGGCDFYTGNRLNPALQVTDSNQAIRYGVGDFSGDSENINRIRFGHNFLNS